MQNLQPYSHYCFSKILRTLFDFLNNTYWVSLFVRNNSLIFRTGVSCFSVTLFHSTLYCCGGKANLVRFTLFYSTLLTLMERMTDGGTKYTRFAWAGGTCPRFAWAGGTFFPVVLLCQFLVLAGNNVLVVHTTMYKFNPGFATWGLRQRSLLHTSDVV